MLIKHGNGRCWSCVNSERDEDLDDLDPRGPFTLSDVETAKLRGRVNLCLECVSLVIERYRMFCADGKEILY